MIASLKRLKGQSGQVIVVMVGVILVSVAMLAVIVDGGNVFAQQRITQNGADGSAQAGAVVLAQRLAGVPVPDGGWDAVVAGKVEAMAAANGLIVKAAYYTDICGIPLRADGTAAIDPGTRKELLATALTVGNPAGALPASAATTPDCPSLTVGPVAGVLVIGEKIVPALVARAINIPSFTVTTRATAVAGYLQGYCDATQGNYCDVLPVTIPVDTITCDGRHRPIDTGEPWEYGRVYRVPLCTTDAGNVGWLDWEAPHGGIEELVCSILEPDNPAIDLPSWVFVTQAGNPNGGGGRCGMSVEDAIRTYDGQVVLIPQFDLTCGPPGNDEPDSSHPAIDEPPGYGCPEGSLGAGGQNLWYRMPSFAFFQLCDPSMPECGALMGAYLNGDNRAVCDTGSGATSCIVGKFTDVLTSGTVGPGAGGGTGRKALGVQLIK